MCLSQVENLRDPNVMQNYNFNQDLPSFTWLVRDFQLDLKDDKGNLVTDYQYLENCLTE